MTAGLRTLEVLKNRFYDCLTLYFVIVELCMFCLIFLWWIVSFSRFCWLSLNLYTINCCVTVYRRHIQAWRDWWYAACVAVLSVWAYCCATWDCPDENDPNRTSFFSEMQNVRRVFIHLSAGKPLLAWLCALFFLKFYRTVGDKSTKLSLLKTVLLSNRNPEFRLLDFMTSSNWNGR